MVVDDEQIDTLADKLSDGVDAIVGTLADVVQHLCRCPVVEFLVVNVANACLQRTDSLQDTLLDGASDAHHLTRSLHLCAKLV